MLALMVSSRPASTLTASYLARLLLAAPALPWVLADRLGLLRASQYNTTLLMILLVRWENKQQTNVLSEVKVGGSPSN